MKSSHRFLRLSLCTIATIALTIAGAACGGVSSNNGGSGGTKTLSSLAVSPATASIQAGESQQFTATAKYNDGSTADVSSTVTWTVNSPSDRFGEQGGSGHRSCRRICHADSFTQWDDWFGSTNGASRDEDSRLAQRYSSDRKHRSGCNSAVHCDCDLYRRNDRQRQFVGDLDEFLDFHRDD